MEADINPYNRLSTLFVFQTLHCASGRGSYTPHKVVMFAWTKIAITDYQLLYYIQYIFPEPCPSKACHYTKPARGNPPWVPPHSASFSKRCFEAGPVWETVVRPYPRGIREQSGLDEKTPGVPFL